MPMATQSMTGPLKMIGFTTEKLVTSTTTYMT